MSTIHKTIIPVLVMQVLIEAISMVLFFLYRYPVVAIVLFAALFSTNIKLLADYAQKNGWRHELNVRKRVALWCAQLSMAGGSILLTQNNIVGIYLPLGILCFTTLTVISLFVPNKTEQL